MLFLVGRLKYQYLDVTKDIALTWENFSTNLKLLTYRGRVIDKAVVDNGWYEIFGGTFAHLPWGPLFGSLGIHIKSSSLLFCFRWV